MLQDIIGVSALSDYRLFLRFEDGTEGIINLRDFVEFDEIFEPLEDPSYFSKVEINSEWGTVFWPNGADLDPDVLYSQLSGKPVPNFEIIKSK